MLAFADASLWAFMRGAGEQAHTAADKIATDISFNRLICLFRLSEKTLYPSFNFSSFFIKK